MKILSKILNNKDIINKEYADNGMSALEQRILALENDKRATEVPIGTIISYASSTPPEGYLKCEGQEVSRTTYSQLFNAIGTTYGAGNGSTTFNLPDLRGEFLRGAGTNSRTTQGSGGTVGEHQNGTIHWNMWAATTNGGQAGISVPDVGESPSGSWYSSGGSIYNTDKASAGRVGTMTLVKNVSGGYLTMNTSDASNATGSFTSRPTNTSVLYCIKYKTYSNIITIDDKYPIGSIYISVDSANPSTLFGGTWLSIGEGRTLVGVGTGTDSNNTSQTFVANSTGGEYSFDMAHTHGLNNGYAMIDMSSGGWIAMRYKSLSSGWNQNWKAKNISWTRVGEDELNTDSSAALLGGTTDSSGSIQSLLQPYIVVYMWKRTA